MHWWNVSQLVEDLRERRVTERERFKYLLAWLVFITVGSEWLLYYGQTFHITHVVFGAQRVLLVIVGILASYYANRSGDNTDFVGRLICLGWPIGVRVMVFYVFFIVVLSVSLTFARNLGLWRTNLPANELFWEVVAVFPQALAYWLLYSYIRRVAHRPEARAHHGQQDPPGRPQSLP